MKRLLLIFGFLMISSINLVADYISGYIECKHISGDGYTYFVVKGKGSDAINDAQSIAVSDFLNSDYAVETNNYCEDHRVYSHNGIVIPFASKQEANRHFTSLINTFKTADYVKKLIIIRNGYDENDWIQK